jgi:hypothetical protein
MPKTTSSFARKHKLFQIIKQMHENTFPVKIIQFSDHVPNIVVYKSWKIKHRKSSSNVMISNFED